VKSDDVRITLYELNAAFKKAFGLLKIQILLVMGAFVWYFMREINKIDTKISEFEKRNVEFIVKNCKAAGVDPAAMGFSEQKIR